jgi:hypothetical protein
MPRKQINALGAGSVSLDKLLALADPSSGLATKVALSDVLGVLGPLSKPTSAGYTWVNQGPATVVDTALGFYLALTSTGTGDQNRALVEAVPTAPYTFTIGIIPNITPLGYNWCGLILRESSSAKLVPFVLFFDNDNIYKIWVVHYTDPTTFSASIVRYPNTLTGKPCYLRISDDSTNRIFWASHDGTNFIKIASEARAAFCTPDQIGFVVGTNIASGYTVGMHVVYVG